MQAYIHFNPISKLQSNYSFNLKFELPIEIISIYNIQQIKEALDKLWQYSLAGFWCVGFISYNAAPAFDPTYIVRNDDNLSLCKTPLLHFAIYNKAYQLINPKPIITNSTKALQIIDTNLWRINHTQYNKNFNKIHEAILAGDVYQINYTYNLYQQVKLKHNFSWLSYYYQLLQKQSSSYSLYLNWEDIQQDIEYNILSFSPELFFHWQPNNQQTILTQPMKGTAKRGKNFAQDRQIQLNLIQSPKERAENIMIVDLLRNDLSRIAVIGSVKTHNIFETLALPTIWQMVSSVSAKTKPNINLYDIFQALFPCGSITGTPKIQAMKLIADIEDYNRGIYCGAIGVIKPYGECIFNVAIRTLQAIKHKQIQHINYGVGSGITIDANCQAEIAELYAKMSFLDFNN